jgi:pyrophosphatase PpaX
MPSLAYETYLFDLDGTLIDSIELIMSSYRHTMAVHVGEVPSDDVWLEGLGTPLWTQFRKFTDDDAEIDRMVATYRTHNLAHHDGMVEEYEGVRTLVDTLSTADVGLAIVTSKKREGALRGLGLMGLRSAFPVVISADDVQRHKPHPEPVHLALERLGAAGTTALFVGDSPHDIAAGAAAGVATAAALWGPFPRAWIEPHDPTHWVDHPLDLLTLKRLTPPA